jgi:glycine cleavage system H protein
MGNWKTPAGLRYTKTDEWVKLEGDTALVGITDYAQDMLSDLVFIEMPDVGKVFKAGEVFGVVESVKAAADLSMPISGEVVETNAVLEDVPETINADAFGQGWIVRIKPSNASEMDSLMDEAAYGAYCAERE